MRQDWRPRGQALWSVPSVQRSAAANSPPDPAGLRVQSGEQPARPSLRPDRPKAAIGGRQHTPRARCPPSRHTMPSAQLESVQMQPGPCRRHPPRAIAGCTLSFQAAAVSERSHQDSHYPPHSWPGQRCQGQRPPTRIVRMPPEACWLHRSANATRRVPWKQTTSAACARRAKRASPCLQRLPHEANPPTSQRTAVHLRRVIQRCRMVRWLQSCPMTAAGPRVLAHLAPHGRYAMRRARGMRHPQQARMQPEDPVHLDRR